MTELSSTEEVKLLLEKSKRKLKRAKEAFNDEDYDSALGDVYRSVELTMRTLLITKGITRLPKTHGGLLQLFVQNPTVLFHLRKNHITSLIKNYQLKNTMKYLPIYLTFLLGHACLTIPKGKTNITIAYIKAVKWTLKNFKYIYTQRLKVQYLIRRVPDSTIMKNMTKPRIPWHLLK